jgi:tetratricopeptide (TPR) repeat protein
MDFGLARDPGGTTERKLDGSTTVSEQPSLTRTGAVTGTPVYMAPEQYVGGGADERSDQFSLCVAIYECLYRERPFRGRTIQAVAYEAMEGIIAPVPPSAPSVPATIRRILLRGLSPQSRQRWPSIDALASGLHRARTPRSRTGWLLGAVAIVGIGGVASTDARQAQDCRDGREQIDAVWTAERRDAAHAVVAAHGDAGPTLVRVEKWRNDWRASFDAACDNADADDPIALDRSVHCLERQLQTFGALSQRWGSGEMPGHAIATSTASLPLPSSCLTEADVVGDPIDPHVRRGLERVLAEVYAATKAGDYAHTRRGAADLVSRAQAEGAPRLAAEAMFELGYAQMLSARFEEADATLSRAFWAALDADDQATAARSASALTYLNSEELLRLEAAQTWLRHAESHLEGANAMHTAFAAEVWTHAALLAEESGRFDDAEALYERAIALHAELFGPDDVHGAAAHHNLAAVFIRRGKPDEARRLYRRAIEMREGAFGPDHPDVASSLTGLATVERSEGNLEVAADFYRRALAIREDTLGPDHPRVLAVLNGLGIIEAMQGHYDAAVPIMKDLAERYAGIYGPEHPTTAGAYDNLGLAYAGASRYDEAVVEHRRGMKVLERVMGPSHMRVTRSAHNLGSALVEAGRFAEAVAPLRQAVDAHREATTGDKSGLEEDLLLLAVARIETGAAEVAIDLAREAVELRAQARPALRAEARFTMAEAKLAAGDRRGAVVDARAALAEVDEDTEPHGTLREDVVAWLADHGRGRGS